MIYRCRMLASLNLHREVNSEFLYNTAAIQGIVRVPTSYSKQTKDRITTVCVRIGLKVVTSLY